MTSITTNDTKQNTSAIDAFMGAIATAGPIGVTICFLPIIFEYWGHTAAIIIVSLVLGWTVIFPIYYFTRCK